MFQDSQLISCTFYEAACGGPFFVPPFLVERVRINRERAR